MSRGVSQKTKKMTTSALLAAMGVALLFIGSLIETLDLSMAALASFFCIFAVIELGGAYPWLIFAVTSVLAVVLMPFSMAGWFYLLFFGYYPILKEKFENLPKLASWGIKMIVLNIALIASVALAYFLFFGQSGGSIIDAFIYIFGGEEVGSYIALGVYVLVNIVFVIYDIALTRLISLYFFKLRPRFKFLK